MRPRWGSGLHVQYRAYSVEVLCPQQRKPWRGKLPQSIRAELVEAHKTESLRQLAKEYGVFIRDSEEDAKEDKHASSKHRRV